jgi:outer membrane protein with beta-barrel domain
MAIPWRPLALAAVLSVAVCVGVADAQTVLIRNAPAGATIEVVLNADTVGTGTVDANGIATLPLKVSSTASKPEIDASIYVDACGDKMRRVVIVDRAHQAPSPDSGCDRRQIIGLFLIKPVSTIVVDVGGANPTVLLRQGPFRFRRARLWGAPTGLFVSGGGVFGLFSDTRIAPCGNVNCTVDDSGLGYTFGVGYWISPYIAAEATYIKPAEATTSGGGTGFNFNSALESHVLTMVGKVGAPVRRARIYGQVGATYQRSTFSTIQTNDPVTLTVGDVTETVPGGTQSFEVRTDGWGWVFGGGAEIWIGPSFAIFGEAGRASLKGEALNEEEGILNQGLTHVLFGGRVRIVGW